MNVLPFLPTSQPTSHPYLHYCRRALTLLLLCQFLWTTVWITAQPAAAAPQQQTPIVSVGTPFEIAISEEVTLADDTLFIWFFAILNDTRCPTGETCAEAGNAEFKFLVNHGDPASEEIFFVSLAAGERVMFYQGYEIELLEVLTPAPRAGVHFITQRYHLRLIVRATDAVERQTPVAQMPAEQANTYTPIQSDEAEFAVAFDSAFILRPGQTAHFSPADLVITLHTITEDSGCLDPWCDEMWLDANLTITTTDLENTGDASGTLAPGDPYVFTFQGYNIFIMKVEVVGEGDLATHQIILTVATYGEESSEAVSEPAKISPLEPPAPNQIPGYWGIFFAELAKS